MRACKSFVFDHRCPGDLNPIVRAQDDTLNIFFSVDSTSSERKYRRGTMAVITECRNCWLYKFLESVDQFAFLVH